MLRKTRILKARLETENAIYDFKKTMVPKKTRLPKKDLSQESSKILSLSNILGAITICTCIVMAVEILVK